MANKTVDRWITVKYDTTCKECGEPVEKGSRAVYSTNGIQGNIYCGPCGVDLAGEDPDA